MSPITTTLLFRSDNFLDRPRVAKSSLYGQ